MCDTGFDGGLQQTFHMEVLSLAENIMYANRYIIIIIRYYDYFHDIILLLRSRDVPSFWASHLPAGEKVCIPLSTCTEVYYLPLNAMLRNTHHSYYLPPMLRNTGLHPRVCQQLQGPLHPRHPPGGDQPRRRGEYSGGVTYHCAVRLVSNTSSQDYASSGRRVAVGGAALFV